MTRGLLVLAVCLAGCGGTSDGAADAGGMDGFGSGDSADSVACGGVAGTWQGLSGVDSVRASAVESDGTPSLVATGTADAATGTWCVAEVGELPLPGLVELMTDDGRVVGAALVTTAMHAVTRVTTVRADVALWMAQRSGGLGQVDLGLVALTIDIGTAGAAADAPTTEALAQATLAAQEVHSRTVGLGFAALHEGSAPAIADLEREGDQPAFEAAWSAGLAVDASDGEHSLNLSLPRLAAAREVVLDDLSGHQSLLSRAAESRGELLAARGAVAAFMEFLGDVEESQVQLIEAALNKMEAPDTDSVPAGQNLAEVATAVALGHFTTTYGAGSAIEQMATSAVGDIQATQAQLASDLRNVAGAGELQPLFVGEEVDTLFRDYDLAVEDALQSLTVSGASPADVAIVLELGLHMGGALLGQAF